MFDAGELAALVRCGDPQADRELTRLAGSGNFRAQRELLTILIGSPDTLYERSFSEVARVELLSRFLALRGNVLDVRRLAGILWQMGRSAPDSDSRRKLYAAEAVGLLRELADDGDGVASEHLSALAADFPDAWEVAEICDGALPVSDSPPPIVRTRVAAGETLGDILAAAFAEAAPAQFGLLGRLRCWLSDSWWRLRLWVSERFQ